MNKQRTALQQAIEQIEERIKYLREQELIALTEIDAIVSPSFVRDMKWKLIHELAARRSELEMYSLKPLQSLLPVEREVIEDAYKDGFDAGTLLSDARAADYDSAQHYFNSKYESI